MRDDQLREVDLTFETGADLSDSQLALLTTLEHEEARRFGAYWDALSGERRLALLQRLERAAKANLTLDFTAVYRHALRDPAPEVRGLAFRLASEEIDSGLVDSFIEAARFDPDPEARLAAVEALGAFTLAAQIEDWPEDLQGRLETTLTRILHQGGSNGAMRRAALLSLSYLTTARSEEEIRRAHLQPDLREAAILAMGRNCQDIWLDILRAELAADDSDIRGAAVAASEELEDARLVPHLIYRIDDPDEEVRLAAIRALGTIGGREAKAALTGLLEARDRPLRAAALEALEDLLANDEHL